MTTKENHEYIKDIISVLSVNDTTAESKLNAIKNIIRQWQDSKPEEPAVFLACVKGRWQRSVRGKL